MLVDIRGGVPFVGATRRGQSPSRSGRAEPSGGDSGRSRFYFALGDAAGLKWAPTSTAASATTAPITAARTGSDTFPTTREAAITSSTWLVTMTSISDRRPLPSSLVPARGNRTSPTGVPASRPRHATSPTIEAGRPRAPTAPAHTSIATAAAAPGRPSVARRTGQPSTTKGNATPRAAATCSVSGTVAYMPIAVTAGSVSPGAYC